MDDSDKLAELVDSVMILREDVKRTDDTLKGVGNTLRIFTQSYTTESHSSDRIRSRMIDIDDKLAKQGERFDRIEETLGRILEKVGDNA